MKNREIIVDEQGVERFKPNRIVGFLLDWGNTDLNQIWKMRARGLFSTEELREFYQLIGYSVSGYEELSFGD